MAVTVYKSTDASAPVLNGLAGSLITVLDAVLVNGYGAKAAAGWTKPYNGTNLAAYRQAAGSLFYLRVDDASPNATALGREAQLRAYEAMTAISTGTNPFPTVGQIAVSGLVVRKSGAMDATAVPWKIVADGRTVYIFTKPANFTGWAGFMFGDHYSLVADLYACSIIGRPTQNSDVDTTTDLRNLIATTATVVGHFVARAWNAAVGSALTGKSGDGAKGGGTTLVGTVVYPNSSDGSLMMSPVWVHENNGTSQIMRGRLRGFWQQLHLIGAAPAEGDTFSGTGAQAGKTFEVIGPASDGLGKYVMETSDTWETN